MAGARSREVREGPLLSSHVTASGSSIRFARLGVPCQIALASQLQYGAPRQEHAAATVAVDIHARRRQDGRGGRLWPGRRALSTRLIGQAGADMNIPEQHPLPQDGSSGPRDASFDTVAWHTLAVADAAAKLDSDPQIGL